MKLSLLLFIIVLPITVNAETANIQSVVDIMRETPVTVHGELAFKKPLTVYEGTKGLIKTTMNLKANEGIGFSFSEEHLSLQTDKGFSINVAGVDIKVKRIYYHEQTGKFEVKTDSPLKIDPLGYKVWGGGEKTMNKLFAEKLDQLFRPKMIAAFQQLKELRASKSLNDVNLVLDTLTKIVASGKKKEKKLEIPPVSGEVNLEFFMPNERNLTFGDLNAEILARDSMTLGLKFDRDEKNNLSINGINVSSKKGITLSGKVAPQIASFVFKSFNADKNNYRLDYHTGADEVLFAYQLVAKSVENGNFQRSLAECDPVQLPLHQIVDRRFKVEFAKMMKLYGSDITKTGVSPELLNHLK